MKNVFCIVLLCLGLAGCPPVPVQEAILGTWELETTTRLEGLPDQVSKSVIVFSRVGEWIAESDGLADFLIGTWTPSESEGIYMDYYELGRVHGITVTIDYRAEIMLDGDTFSGNALQISCDDFDCETEPCAEFTCIEVESTLRATRISK